MALTVCGFAGAQAVLVGLLTFMLNLGGGIGPATVAGLSGIVSVPVALAVLAVLPAAGLVLAVTRRPGARCPAESRVSPASPGRK
ncbi:hypothetical protein [Kibdelosporangium phytohabitans]|uniref:Uncharacterized protein n=1 Tax=Kibdelosporangium phytohabitans TaxID=860235 RepID=A0A0N9I5H2_9PSEU|nr:hypothetical protein [Kibdelosporangium phytohabitans]ALG10122.1 hypothetical protein AOZ06_27360 [Kibdelosporangium phytohabitans]MBE1461109.1 hypothetical protein [Kibdelosporangium phytohabitans]